MKEDCPHSSQVPISDSRSILKSELLTLLKTYNCYHEGRSFQLRHQEEEGALIIEGLLNIAWGLRRPIWLQIQDDREPVYHSSASLVPGQSSYRLKKPPLKDGRVSAQRPSIQPSEHRAESSRDSSEPLEEDKEVPQLMHTKSDAGCVIQRRPRCCTPSETQRIWQHHFSISGHFYNHKTSIFTPAYGSVTNVRVNSTMTTLKVLTLLLNKFRVKNSPSEFALYIVRESGERTKLKDCEYPLISRILHGPCEKIARIFLMEADLGEEVPHDVAQYIKFEMPVLDSFVEKLKEEEQREIIKLTMKFQALRLTMLQHLEQLVEAISRQPSPPSSKASSQCILSASDQALIDSHHLRNPVPMLPPAHLPKSHKSHIPGSWLHGECSQDPDTGMSSRNWQQTALTLAPATLCGWIT